MRRRSLWSGIALAGTILTTALAGPAEAATVPPGEALLPLTRISADRVALADKVAAAKFGTDQPIDDPAREKQVLDSVAHKSAQLGIDPQVSVRIFRDQIEANKLVQRALFARWTAHPEQAPTERPDLATEVRPILDRITDLLLAQIKATGTVRSRPSCDARLTVSYVRVAHAERHLDMLHAGGLVRALPSVCS